MVIIMEIHNFYTSGFCSHDLFFAQKADLGRGFKSHPVHFFLLYNYGIELRLFLMVGGQIQQQVIPMAIVMVSMRVCMVLMLRS